MRKILITGASGNIGRSLVEYLYQYHNELEIVLATTNLNSCHTLFGNLDNIAYMQLDFEQPGSYKEKLCGFDLVFLLRPPHINEAHKYFQPFIDTLEYHKVKQIVFSSVYQAKWYTPHYKIEQMIKKSSLDYIFMRPSYFMQNFITTLALDVQKGKIFLPINDTKLLWVDTRDIALATANLIYHFEEYKNKSYEITSRDCLSFSEIKSSKFGFQHISPLKFYLMRYKKGKKSLSNVLNTILYASPRFNKTPKMSDDFQRIGKQEPRSLQAFLEEKNLL